MNPGIKVGPTDGIQILKQSGSSRAQRGAKYCEIYHRLDWQKKYLPLFEFLNKNKINFGLHFWAMVDEKYFPNLLSSDNNIAQQTFQLIKKTIDIASKFNAYYVNFHPESYNDAFLDLDNQKIKVIKKNFNKEQQFENLVKYLKKINQYAKKKQIVPFIETVPKFMPTDFKKIKKGRLNPQKAIGLETEGYLKLSKMGFPICLDFGHTMGQLITGDREKLFNYLYNTAKKLKKSIGLIHVTTNAPPFNGTDSHNGVLEKDFQQGVVPNKKQLIKLLKLFKDKNVWLIPEPPKGEMLQNHYALKKIVSSIEN